MKLICTRTYITILLGLLSVLVSLAAVGQEASLQNVNGLSDTEKVNALLVAYDEVISSKPDTAITYAQKALALSEKHQYELGRANSHYRLGVAYTNFGDFELALGNLNASKHLYKKLHDDKGVILSYKYLGTLYNYSGDNEEALKNYIYASDLAEKINLNTESLKITNNIGMIYLKQQYFDLAIEYFLKSLRMGPEKYAESIILGNLGQAYKNKGDADQALEYYEKGLEICREINDVSCEINQLGYISQIYSNRQKYDKALEYSFIVKDKLEQVGTKRELIVIYNRIALTYQYQQKYDSAIKYFNKGRLIADETKSPSLHLIHANLAMAYNESKQYKLALDHLFIHQEIKDSLHLIDRNKGTEEILAKYEGEKREKEIALLKREKEFQAVLLKSQKTEFDREQLQKNLETYQSELKMTQLKTENELQLLSLQREQAKAEKKESQIGLLEKEKELQKAELRRQALMKNVAIIGAFFILIVAFVFLIIYQQKIKTQELLSLKTKEYNEQKSIEMIRENEISAINAKIEGQEKERERIARELHDGIAGNLAGIKLNLSKLSIDKEQNLDLKKIIGHIDETYNEVRSISHHLIPSKMQSLPFVQLIENYLDDLREAHAFEIHFKYHTDQLLNRLSDKIKIEVYRVIQELMNNIIKHADTDQVDIQLTKLEDHVNLMVEDQGVGFEIHKTSKGIGLDNIASRVNALQGDFDIDTSINRGTIVNINIPIVEIGEIFYNNV